MEWQPYENIVFTKKTSVEPCKILIYEKNDTSIEQLMINYMQLHVTNHYYQLISGELINKD